MDIALESPLNDNQQPDHTGSVANRVNKDRAFRLTIIFLLKLNTCAGVNLHECCPVRQSRSKVLEALHRQYGYLFHGDNAMV